MIDLVFCCNVVGCADDWAEEVQCPLELALAPAKLFKVVAALDVAAAEDDLTLLAPGAAEVSPADETALADSDTGAEEKVALGTIEPSSEAVKGAFGLIAPESLLVPNTLGMALEAADADVDADAMIGAAPFEDVATEALLESAALGATFEVADDKADPTADADADADAVFEAEAELESEALPEEAGPEDAAVAADAELALVDTGGPAKEALPDEADGTATLTLNVNAALSEAEAGAMLDDPAW